MQSREGVREFGRRKNAARAGALDFRPIWDRRAIGLFQKNSIDEGTRPRSMRAFSQSTFSQHGIPGQSHAEPWAWHAALNQICTASRWRSAKMKAWANRQPASRNNEDGPMRRAVCAGFRAESREPYSAAIWASMWTPSWSPDCGQMGTHLSLRWECLAAY